MTDVQSALESIPHLSKRVCAIWGHPELETYINTLVMDARDGSRKGLPMEIGAELLWLAKVNKIRQAIDLSEKLKISLRDAQLKLDRDERSEADNAWSNQAQKGRRYTDKPITARPHRRHEENTVFGIIYGALTSKLVLFLIILILTAKSVWSYVKVFF
ncbi:MAG: hypothetical protein EKK46_06000 [Rhodocyclaceae bacterium]|nr:MAG: hypothetical protein EKK46_06000 [Rhodocyclaceae bacterium]